MSEKLFWEDSYSSDGDFNDYDYDNEDDDNDLLEECFDQIEDQWNIDDCDEDLIVDFLRNNNYDVDVCVAAGLRGAFGDFIPRYQEFDVSYSSKGKAKVCQVKAPGPNVRYPTSTKVATKPQKKQKDEEAKIIHCLFTGGKQSGKTILIDKLKNKDNNRLETKNFVMQFTEGDKISDFFTTDVVFFVIDVSNSQFGYIRTLVEMSIAEHCLTHVFVLNKFDKIARKDRPTVYERFKGEISKMYKQLGLSNPIGIVPISVTLNSGIKSANFPFYHLNTLIKVMDLVPNPPRDANAKILFTASEKMPLKQGSGSVYGTMRLGTMKFGQKVTLYPSKLPFTVKNTFPKGKILYPGSVGLIEIGFDGSEAPKDGDYDDVVIGERITEDDEGFQTGLEVEFEVYSEENFLYEHQVFDAEFATFNRSGKIISISGSNIVKAVFDKPVVIAPKVRGFVLTSERLQYICQLISAE